MSAEKTTTWTLWATAACAGVALSLLGGVLGGCRGDRSDDTPRQFFPDMDDAPKWKPQVKSGFYADGRTMRPTVPGTVPFGRERFVTNESWAEPWMMQRAALLRDSGPVSTGVGPDGNYLAVMPIEVTPDLIATGEKKFNIYCAACHGYQGDGQGMVGKQWASPVPSYHQTTYQDRSQKQGTDGWIFHVARYGFNNMPGYAHAINEREAWGVVAYVRVLQEQRNGTLQDLSQADRETLLKTRPDAAKPATPAPAPAGGGAGGAGGAK